MCSSTNTNPTAEVQPNALYRVSKDGESWEVRIPTHVAVALGEAGHAVALRVGR
jgi:hypothetical protein